MNDEPVKARFVTQLPRSQSRLSGRVPVHDSIMVMPGGVHTINASRQGKPYSTTVHVNEATALTCQKSLLKLKAEGQRMWCDKDHQENESTGWVEGFEWRDDPEPGVYARIEWTDLGASLIAGRVYRSVSPAFFTDDSVPASVTGIDRCALSLVNQPAFRKMSPLWARENPTPAKIGDAFWLPGAFGNPVTLSGYRESHCIATTTAGEQVFLSYARLKELTGS